MTTNNENRKLEANVVNNKKIRNSIENIGELSTSVMSD